MFEFIKSAFPYKAKSVEEFVKLVEREACKAAVVVPCTVAKGAVPTTSIGIIAHFRYVLEFTATTPRSRKVVYKENLFERFGSDSGFGDANERRKAAIKAFLLGEQKVKELQAKLQGVTVDLMGPNGRPMDDRMYAELHEDAVVCDVSV